MVSFTVGTDGAVSFLVTVGERMWPPASKARLLPGTVRGNMPEILAVVALGGSLDLVRLFQVVPYVIYDDAVGDDVGFLGR